MSAVPGATVTDTTVERAVPLRPLGVAELLDSAVRVVRRNVRASFAIALPVAIVGTAVTAATNYAALDDTGLALPELLVQLFVGSLTGVVLGGLLAPVYVGEVAADVTAGRHTGAQALRRVGRSAWALAGLALVYAFGVEVGAVALVVGGVWLWGVWALAAPALVTERLGALQSLRRSVELTRGAFWRVWGVRALSRVATTVLGAFVTIPFTALAALLSDSDLLDAETGVTDVGLYVTIASLGTLLAQVILPPVEAAVDTLLYVDARMRREGLDLVLALDADAARTATVAAAPEPPAW